MKTKLTFLLSLTFLFLFSGSSVVFAGATTNYMVKPRMAWSAFDCAVLASINKSKEDEINRLFDFGYKAAKEFILAIKEKKLNDENFDRGKLPLMYKFFMGTSPSIDFHIGRMYQFIERNVYDNIEKEINNDKLWMDLKFRKQVASRIFFEKNCQLIGLE